MQLLEKLHTTLYDRLLDEPIIKGHNLDGWRFKLALTESDIKLNIFVNLDGYLLDEEDPNEEPEVRETIKQLNQRFKEQSVFQALDRTYSSTRTLSELIDQILEDIQMDLVTFVAGVTEDYAWFLESVFYTSDVATLHEIIKTIKSEEPFIKSCFTQAELDQIVDLACSDEVIFIK